MTKAANNTSLDLNTAFHRYHELGLVRSLKARGKVKIIESPKRGIRAVLLLDYQTSAWDPRLASAQAIAAEYLFDGMSERQYLAHIHAAKAQFGVRTEQQGAAAEMQALRLLVAAGQAVCIFRDDKVLEMLGHHLPASLVQVHAETIAHISNAPLYDGKRELAGANGPIASDAVGKQVNSTLAVGMTCFTTLRIQEELAAGEHPNWRFVRARAA